MIRGVYAATVGKGKRAEAGILLSRPVNVPVELVVFAVPSERHAGDRRVDGERGDVFRVELVSRVGADDGLFPRVGDIPTVFLHGRRRCGVRTRRGRRRGRGVEPAERLHSPVILADATELRLSARMTWPARSRWSSISSSEGAASSRSGTSQGIALIRHVFLSGDEGDFETGAQQRGF